jgi:crotonobetainyl-CoA:carnitine CoA-transferase CaiB-like acyl-CoA transferase
VASPIWGPVEAASSRPPPLLGEHTAEVLAELGHSDAEIAEMLASGVAATP